MTRHDDISRLRHMLDYAQEAVELAKDRRREELGSDRLLRHALTRLVEVVGEAAARVSEEGIVWFPDIPLREARTMRNRLIHGYDAVDLDTLWDTIQDDLPSLIRQLRKTLGKEA